MPESRRALKDLPESVKVFPLKEALFLPEPSRYIPRTMPSFLSKPALTQLCVFIENMRVPAHIGVEEAERNQPQDIEVSVRAELQPADYEDASLGDTLDYDAFRWEVRGLVGERAYVLLEHLGADLLTMGLAHPLVQKVFVRLVKPTLYGEGESCGISMEQAKN